MQISWQLINFCVTCNANIYSRFWCVSLNNLKRFFKKSLWGVFKIPLLYLYNKFRSFRPWVPRKDGKNGKKNKLFALKCKKIFFKIVLKKLDRFFKKKISLKSSQKPSQYLCTKFRSCRYLCFRLNVYTDWFTDERTKLRLRFIMHGRLKKILPKCAITCQR